MRTISHVRLSTLTTRLLAVASVLITVGVGLTMSFAWGSSAVVYEPDGEVAAPRLSMFVIDLSFRQPGVPLVVSAGLVAAAVETLQRHPSRTMVRRLRWEVLVAGLLILVVAVPLALANLYVLMGPTGTSEQSFGPSSPSEFTAGHLMSLAAALLVLTVAALWWWRLGADEPDADAVEDTAADGVAEDMASQGDAEPVDEESSLDPTSRIDDQVSPDYRRDWSPEDFRRPR